MPLCPLICEVAMPCSLLCYVNPLIWETDWCFFCFVCNLHFVHCCIGSSTSLIPLGVPWIPKICRLRTLLYPCDLHPLFCHKFASFGMADRRKAYSKFVRSAMPKETNLWSWTLKDCMCYLYVEIIVCEVCYSQECLYMFYILHSVENRLWSMFLLMKGCTYHTLSFFFCSWMMSFYLLLLCHNTNNPVSLVIKKSSLC